MQNGRFGKEAQMADAHAKLRSEVERLNGEVATRDERIATLSTSQEEMKAALDASRSRANELQAQVSTLDRACFELREFIDTNDIPALRERVATAEAQRATAMEDFTLLRMRSDAESAALSTAREMALKVEHVLRTAIAQGHYAPDGAELSTLGIDLDAPCPCPAAGCLEARTRA